mgnify:CR=1 FL=1
MTSHFLSIAFVIYSFGINLCREIHASCQSLDGWLFMSGFDIIVMQNQLVSAQTYMYAPLYGGMVVPSRPNWL